MFNIGSGEIALIAVVALLVLGPSRLPELARGIGKFMREFRRQTDEVRGVVEREFYKMDADVSAPDAPHPVQPAEGGVAMNAPPPPDPGHDENGALLPGYGPDGTLLPVPDEQSSSQLTAGMPKSSPVAPLQRPRLQRPRRRRPPKTPPRADQNLQRAPV